MSSFDIYANNGIVSMKTGLFTPYDENKYPKKIPISWPNSIINTEYINEFILDLMGGNKVNAMYLQKLVGSLLVDNTKNQVIFYGRGKDDDILP